MTLETTTEEAQTDSVEVIEETAEELQQTVLKQEEIIADLKSKILALTKKIESLEIIASDEEAEPSVKPLAKYKYGEFVQVNRFATWVNGRVVENNHGIVHVATERGEVAVGSPDNIKMQ